MRQFLLISTAFVLGMAPLAAQDASTVTLTITLAGTVNLISGPDCLAASGETASASAMISESATPVATTSNSATYQIPAGGVSATVGSTTFTSTHPWSMRMTLGATYDSLVLTGPGPLGSVITTTSTLKKGSWTSAILTHPAPFTPSPQNQNPSDSKLRYTSPFCSATTVLGVTGHLSNHQAAAVAPAFDTLDQ